MAATMDKANVIYGGDEKVKPNAVDWAKIAALTKPVTLDLAAAKKQVEEAAKDPGMANAYVKVGTIGDDLYLRVKLKKGLFKKNIREDSVIAKGYLKLKNAVAKDTEVKKEITKKEDEKAKERKEILTKTPSQASQEGVYGKRMEAEFDKILKEDVQMKHKDVMDRIKFCGDYLAKKPVTRQNAVQAKMNHAAMPAFINGLEDGLKSIDDLVKKTPFLAGRKKEIDQYRSVDMFRKQEKDFGVKVQEAINAARQAAPVTEEYRQAREKVIADYQKVIDDIKKLQPRANGLLGPAQQANGFPAIKQQYEAAEALRQDAIKAFSPTREGGDISNNARKVLTKEDVADYLFDLTTAAKTANLEVGKAQKAALAVLEGKLKVLQPQTPEVTKLLETVISQQRSMNK